MPFFGIAIESVAVHDLRVESVMALQAPVG